MTTVWSRWLLGAWAVATAVWLLVATLLLVETWPAPLRVGPDTALMGKLEAPSLLERAVQGRTGAGVAPGVWGHVKNVLLLAILPPAILLAFVLASMRLAGLPLPFGRPHERRPNSKR
jgi:hypothetical protein